MRVALLSDCYLPRLGGIEVQVHDLARSLRQAGHEAVIITATQGPDEPIDDVPVERLAIPLPGGVPVNPLAPPKVRRLLLDGGFDVAHVHMGVVSPFAMDSMRVALGVGIPTVATWHCVLAHAAPLVDAAGYVERWADRGAELTAVSQVAAAPLRRMSGGAPVSVLPNGIDVARWSPGPRPEASTGSLRVVTAMRLALRKRPLDLVKVVARARELAPGADLRLEILGEGPQRRRLEAWSARHGAQEWLSLPGRVTREELHRRYLASDVYVAPAELEAFGIAALEARASGLPVVGPRRSGITEFVADGRDGLLVDDDEQFAQALARLATDADLRDRLGAYARSTPVRQDWGEVVAQTVQAYGRARA